MQTELEKLISLYRELEIDKQIDYDKFYLYSLITHSTACLLYTSPSPRD